MASDRARMVKEQIVARGLRDERVLQAMRSVRRERFMPQRVRHLAYVDSPVPIGHGQTISQPWIVAIMTELLRLGPTDRVLEVGTGMGYQAAVLGSLVAEVHSLEIVAPLCLAARDNLLAEGMHNVTVHCGNGYAGLPAEAPFDAILVAAAPEHIPQALLQQLAPGARLVLPVGPVHGVQDLKLVTRTQEGFAERSIFAVRFVPMTGDPAVEHPDMETDPR